MTWHLYASPRSPFVRKVRIAAHEVGLAEQLVSTDVVTTPMAPAAEVLAVNPMGMIPTLIVDDQPMFDSYVILDYLDQLSEGSLFGKGNARQDVLHRHAMANAAMDKAVRILDEQFRTQNDDTAAHISGYVAAINRTLDWFSTRLRDERFDAGDICLATLLSYLDMRFPQVLWRDGAQTVSEWYAQVAKRSSMVATAFQTPPFV